MSTAPLAVIGSVLSAVVITAIAGGLPWAARTAIELAVRQLPKEHRERYLDEWLADIEHKSSIGAMLWAIGTCAAAQSLGRDLGAPPATSRVARALSARFANRAARARSVEVAILAVLGAAMAVVCIWAFAAVVLWLHRTFRGPGTVFLVAAMILAAAGWAALVQAENEKQRARRAERARKAGNGRS